MHDGVIPGTFSANVIKRIPNEEEDNKDMKSQNRRNAPSRRMRRTSFSDWLRFRTRAEDEEYSDDDEKFGDEDLDDEELDGEKKLEEPDPFADEDDPEECPSIGDEEDDPEEFDDFDEEKELDFDDEGSPFPLPAGRFKDFYRMDSSDGMEEEEEDTPGGFEPGQAVGTIGGMGSDVPKIERARILMRQLVNKPGITREEIIQQFKDRLPTTDSTATSYYEDIAREMGLTGKDPESNMDHGGGTGADEPVEELPGDNTQELSQEQIASQDPNGQGIMRTVDKAHMVYKRQMEDGKFEELWVYNSGDRINDALAVRREILSGTDIPRGHTKSEDGQQSYTLTTMGNAQLLHVTGLAN